MQILRRWRGLRPQAPNETSSGRSCAASRDQARSESVRCNRGDFVFAGRERRAPGQPFLVHPSLHASRTNTRGFAVGSDHPVPGGRPGKVKLCRRLSRGDLRHTTVAVMSRHVPALVGFTQSCPAFSASLRTHVPAFKMRTGMILCSPQVGTREDLRPASVVRAFGCATGNMGGAKLLQMPRRGGCHDERSASFRLRIRSG